MKFFCRENKKLTEIYNNFFGEDNIKKCYICAQNDSDNIYFSIIKIYIEMIEEQLLNISDINRINIRNIESLIFINNNILWIYNNKIIKINEHLEIEII